VIKINDLSRNLLWILTFFSLVFGITGGFIAGNFAANKSIEDNEVVARQPMEGKLNCNVVGTTGNCNEICSPKSCVLSYDKNTNEIYDCSQNPAGELKCVCCS